MSGSFRGCSKWPRGNTSRGGRPPGLKGKEIGMYYKNLRSRRNQEEAGRIHLGPSVSAPPAILERVKDYLRKFEQQTQDEEGKVSTEFKERFQDLLSVRFEEFLEKSKKQPTSKGEEESRTELSKRFKEQLLAKEDSEGFRQSMAARMNLPAMKQQERILEGILKNQVTLIVGSTGCGKTTQVPQLLLDYNIRQGSGAQCRIVCTQPRRISAISVAERVASERCESLGGSVGYQIRLESVMPREHGSILYCTTGILLQKMHTNLLVNGVGFIILDEIHERSVETDLLMALLKKILPHRPDLKVVLMSATVCEEDFCKYFDSCCTIRIDGTLFPVKVYYLEDILQETGFNDFHKSAKVTGKKYGRSREARSSEKKERDYNALIEPYLHQIRGRYDSAVLQSLKSSDSEGCSNIQFLEYLVFYICENKPAGAILIFLPGYSAISKLNAVLQNPTHPMGRRHYQKLQVYALHSLMQTHHQRSVFHPAPAGMRKVILSTIIAETSVTIDDVVYVINTGRTKVSNYDAEANIQTLEEAWVTKANSMQRKGRAGRVQPGICYNLFTRARELSMDEVPTPEILRCKLESIILNLKLLHITDENEFLQTLLSAPLPEAIQNAIKLLKRINALDASGLLTPLGMHLAHLPIDPQMGKMILMAALFRCLDPITSVAAGISHKSPFHIPLGQEQRVDKIKQELAANSKSDHLLLNNVILRYRKASANKAERHFCYTNFLSPQTLDQLENMKQQFAGILKTASFLDSGNCQDEQSNLNSRNEPLLRAVIAAGLYPNMAHLRKARQIRNRVHAIHTMSTPEDRRVNFHPSSVNSGVPSFDSNYFVYFQKQKSSDLYILDATMVFPMALLIFGDDVETGVTPERTSYIGVAKSFFFKCDKETADVVVALRNRMEWLLQKKALYPSTIALNSSDEYLIKAIQVLLSLDEISDTEDLSTDDEERSL